MGGIPNLSHELSTVSPTKDVLPTEPERSKPVDAGKSKGASQSADGKVQENSHGPATPSVPRILQGQPSPFQLGNT